MNTVHRLAVSGVSMAVLVLLGTVGLQPAYSSNDATMSISISIRCEGGMAAVIPHTAYLITVPQGGPASPSQRCKSELMVDGGLTVDGRIDSQCSWNQTGLQIHHKTPAMALTGMLCQPMAHAELQVTNSSSGHAGDVAIQDPNHPIKSADYIAKDETRNLFGDGGTIRQTGIKDGDDYDHIRNGSILFGGTNEQTGGTMTVVNIPQQALDGDASASPNITFAFSAR